MRVVAVVILSLLLAPTAHAAPPRLLYTGDWSGSREIYSVDPAHGSIAQLTFGHEASCDPLADACGFTDIVPSPDGRHIAFDTEGLCYANGYFYPADSGSLYVARPDGRARRPLAQLNSSGCPKVAWSPDSRRLAYVVNPYSNPEIYIVDADGSQNDRFSYGSDPTWSPGGHMIALLDNHELYVNPGGHWWLPATSVDEYAWSPTSRWIAIITRYPESQLELVRPDGSETRQLTNGSAEAPSWSHDGRFIAYGDDRGLEVADLATRTTRLVDEDGQYQDEHAWSSRGHLLAFNGHDGLSLFDADRGTARVLTSDSGADLAWSPDDRSIAYRHGSGSACCSAAAQADVRIVTISGHVHTAVAGSGTAGGIIGSFTWTRPLGKLRYRRVEPRSVATVSENELTAPWAIERIAADGSHVVYATCGHLFTWTPATRDVRQAEQIASLTPKCTTTNGPVSFDIYDLALAGDRIAFGTRNGGMSQGWDLYQQPFTDPATAQGLADNFDYAECTVRNAGLGDLAGAGDLLVFSRWHEFTHYGDCGPIVSQEIDRVDGRGCPCPQLAASPGPLLPVDVNTDRVVAVGTNETEVVDPKGKLLLSVPVQAAAAQLTGSHLVVVVQGQLRDYDATTGALLHAWPLPDVPSGSPCASPHPWGCPAVQLELEDADRDLAAYLLNGYLHVMQFTNGADQTVAKDVTTARFIDTGLVYATGNELHLVTYDKLPCC